MKYRHLFVTVIAASIAASSASAHPGHDAGRGLAAGLAHPFSGLDHILAMVAVGLLAGQRGGRATWLLPAVFLSFMLAGGLLALGGMPIPLVEQGIMASVLVLGVCVMLATRVPPSAIIVLPAIFAVCHGYAHVREVPAGLALAAYAAGFLTATATLHLAGIALGLAARRLAPERAARFAGAAIAACGLLMFAGTF